MTVAPPTPTGGRWDDDRLGSAFRVRALSTPTTPSNLADEVLAGSRADRWAWRWPRLTATAAAATLVVVLGGSLILGQVQLDPGSSNVPGSADPLPTSQPDSAVLEALGDPVTVSEALAVRDSEINEREIVAQGFLSPQPIMFCAFDPGPQNPTRLRCSEDMQWLMETPEDLFGTSDPGSNEIRHPNSPSFHLSFALVDPPVVPIPEPDNASPVLVVLIGHFHDRRAARCEAAERDACGETFVVDRVLEDNGTELPVRTQARTEASPHDPESDIDALVAVAAPSAVVVSRQLLPVAQTFAIEPVLADDQLVPYIDQSKLAWLATTVDLIDGVPIARTFMLLDGSSWFAEVTQSGALILERSAPSPTGRPSPLAPSAQPGSFDSAPTSVLGIRVRSIREVADLRQSDGLPGYRDEYAIRAYYLAPRPGVSCDPELPPMHAPMPPCDEARHWLLGDPLQYGVEQGQLRRDPDPFAPTLNPLLPVDVPFDVGETWNGTVPAPQPVIVLGHFADTRVNNVYRGDAYFVIDAVAWTRDTPVGSLDRVSRLTSTATEPPAAAIARVEAISPELALATWATVVDSSAFGALEPYFSQQVTDEFTTGPPVWIIRRLVVKEDELNPYLAVEIGFTADGRTRVWWAESDSSQADLATSIDLRDFDENTELVQVYDYGQSITAVRDGAGRGPFEWHRAGPDPLDGLEVARGGSTAEIAVRWNAGFCGSSIRLLIHDFGDGIRIEARESGDQCDGDRSFGPILIEFEHQVDVDKVFTGDPCCG
jgi:hypothetical protein